MDGQELRKQCLALAGAGEEFPFGGEVSVFKVAGKMFALCSLDDEPLQLSVKCQPDLAVQLRAGHPAIVPGYHLNKRHWNTITLDGSLPDQMVSEMIVDSYDLVVASLPKARRPKLPAMRRVVPVLALTGLLAAGGCSGPAGSQAARHKSPPASYYLALGDSLARGVQPDASGTSVKTAQGYADQLYALLHRKQPGLRLVKLGCTGETTATMIHGGICSYPGGSQLADALTFLRAHRSRVTLVTLDIGANDPETCLTATSLGALASCGVRFVPRAIANLKTIVARLRQAGRHVRMVAMNYYLPALAEWRNGLTGRLLARLGELATNGYNTLLTNVYRDYAVRVANVSGAFHTSDFSPDVRLPGLGSLPRNVAAVCHWTWECASSPRGPNQHPNQAGYQAIARAFLAAGA
ncbi:MAG TPA: MmcQ/YjbR family DNA-binding protein [Streptosporangiaceae bacterium]